MSERLFQATKTLLTVSMLTLTACGVPPLLTEDLPDPNDKDLPFTPPITAIQISESGLYEFVRSFTPFIPESNDSSENSDSISPIQNLNVMIPIKVSSLDHVLQSITVKGKGVKHVEISTPSLYTPSPINHLPIQPQNLRSNAALLAGLTGEKITIVYRGRNLTGTLLGVSADDQCSSDSAALEKRLLRDPCGGEALLLRGDTVYPVAIDDIASIALESSESQTILKAVRLAYQRKLTRLQHKGPITQVNVKIQHLQEHNDQDIHITTVVPEPLWQPSYRVKLRDDGTFELGAWMVMENNSLEDWNDVSISLESGKGTSHSAKLSDRLSADDEEVFDTPSLKPVNLGNLQHKSTHQIPEKLNIKKGDLVSVPILSKPFDSSLLNYYRGGTDNANKGYSSRAHTVMAMKNPLAIRLPPGIATLFSERYVSDIPIPEMHSQEYHVMTIGTSPDFLVTQIHLVDEDDDGMIDGFDYEEIRDSLSQDDPWIAFDAIRPTIYQVHSLAEKTTELTLFHEAYVFSSDTDYDYSTLTHIKNGTDSYEHPVENLDRKRVIFGGEKHGDYGYEIKMNLKARESKKLVVVEVLKKIDEYKRIVIVE